jgi:hypothetical protein
MRAQGPDDLAIGLAGGDLAGAAEVAHERHVGHHRSHLVVERSGRQAEPWNCTTAASAEPWRSASASVCAQNSSRSGCLELGVVLGELRWGEVVAGHGLEN